MGNVLDPSKQQQVIALGRLGWPLRRIEQETGIRRETASAYLRAAGIAVRGRGRPGEEKGKPAISAGVSTDPARPWPPPGRAPCASACEPMPPALGADMFAQELTGGRCEEPDVELGPLHLHALANPAGRGRVVRGVDLDAAVEMHGPYAVAVIPKRLDRQRPQGSSTLRV